MKDLNEVRQEAARRGFFRMKHQQDQLEAKQLLNYALSKGFSNDEAFILQSTSVEKIDKISGEIHENSKGSSKPDE